ncbi:helix-turn-helix domain-containing protein [Streptomyces zhihengii]|uniref:Helix-turn-helix domain-containing protein n=1 Tax=Streptomyces zhihengii TaxID=1818004 RepID=A0ABS2V2J5_9ACTN|nr:helix-turn-helix domain-containing protein [Streptomyces zhihengii]MBM9623935.1 helix-turn-helix domain-containing protein [Streptomyces zhihengii]
MIDSGSHDAADVADSADEGMTAHGRVFHVLQTLNSMGPGLHPLRRIIDESGVTKSTVHRILRAGVAAKHLIYRSPGRYGVATDVAHHRPDASVHLNLAHDSALDRETTALQRQTAQVAMAFSAVMIDDTPGRLMVEHTYGRRSDFQAAFNHADIDAKVALRHAPLTADAAGLAILSHLDGAPQSHLMREIRSEGYVMTQSSLPDWKMIGVPLWRGSTVYGSLVVMGLRPQMERNRREYAAAALACAARLSARCELASGAMRMSA